MPGLPAVKRKRNISINPREQRDGRIDQLERRVAELITQVSLLNVAVCSRSSRLVMSSEMTRDERKAFEEAFRVFITHIEDVDLRARLFEALQSFRNQYYDSGRNPLRYY